MQKQVLQQEIASPPRKSLLAMPKRGERGFIEEADEPGDAFQGGEPLHEILVGDIGKGSVVQKLDEDRARHRHQGDDERGMKSTEKNENGLMRDDG